MFDLNKLGMLLILLGLPMLVGAQPNGFEVDEKLRLNARKWAEEFVTFAADQYEIELDWSHTSIKYLDEIADDLHRTYVKEKPPEEDIIPIARALGGYVAEVYRIFNGGPWGWVEMESGSFPAVQAASGSTFLPFAKALDRIKSGDDPDIWEYYQLLSSQ